MGTGRIKKMFVRRRKLLISMVLSGLLSILFPLSANADSASEVINKVESNLNGKTAVMVLSMMVKTKRTERTIEMESYSIGKEKSFIKILYPGKDRGITFLKIDNSMWQYVPRIEKTIKIPASMMLQSWMGSDFSNDDLIKESSISEDYNQRLLEESDAEYQIELLPTDNSAVVWGKIIMSVSKEYYLPARVQYFDEDGILIRELIYSDVKPFGDRFYPTRWLMLPKEPQKADNKTIITISKAVFDTEVDESYFSKRALKRYSK
jgi:outer membrane lipoprotein-sorting protein